MKQRGVVLFFALIALLAMSLAAVALIRSVDTSTMIAGNLAFKQSATSSGDAGVEAAITWLSATEAANISALTGINVLTDPALAHPFNNTGGKGAFLNPGYFSNADPAVSLTDGTGIQWTNADSVLVTPDPDPSGNTIRYVIQRMCRTANTPIATANCLFSGAIVDKSGQNIPLPQDICTGPGCPVAGQTPQIRITTRTTGLKNTISYIQAFVF
jgi:Tfp pilus assembly protein PilX